MFDSLKQECYEANMLLPKLDLVIYTFGNVSCIDRAAGVFAIKPSGVDYDKLKPSDIVIVDLNGKIVDGTMRPSSDTNTHLELYKAFPTLGGIVHTHSTFATAFAQAGKDIIPLGTTHADTFYQNIPCAKKLSAGEIKNNYEANTGKAIVKEFARRHLDYLATPAVLLESHGPFAWGKDAHEAVKNAITLEAVAKMNFLTYTLNPKVKKIDRYLSNKHYERKHGKNAYYGQK